MPEFRPSGRMAFELQRRDKRLTDSFYESYRAGGTSFRDVWFQPYFKNGMGHSLSRVRAYRIHP
jgi:hypothetical protein